MVKHEQDSEDDILSRSVLERGIEIHSTRCGDFKRGIQALSQNPAVLNVLKNKYMSSTEKLENISAVMELAADSSRSLKVIINTGKEEF